MFRVLLVTLCLWAVVALSMKSRPPKQPCPACDVCDKPALNVSCHCNCTPYSLPAPSCLAPTPCPPCPTVPLPAISMISPSLPSGYEVQPRVIYKFFGCDHVLSWNDANEVCVKDGGYLAIPRTMTEVYMLVGMQTIEEEKTSTPCTVHVGFHDKDKDGKFESVFGEPSEEIITKKMWAEGEPDGGGAETDVYCLALDKKGLADLDCEEPLAFVCQLKSD